MPMSGKSLNIPYLNEVGNIVAQLRGHITFIKNCTRLSNNIEQYKVSSEITKSLWVMKLG